MAAYATVAELREYLDKLGSGVADAQLQAVLDRARSIVDLGLGFSFFDAGGEWPAATARTVRADGTPYLRLPPYQEGSITGIVVAGTATAVTGWAEAWSAGRGVLERYPAWDVGRYTVTAAYGYGAAPAAVVEVNLEVAVNIWQARQAGRFSDVVGAEGGGAVGYQKALTAQQAMILKQVRNQYMDMIR